MKFPKVLSLSQRVPVMYQDGAVIRIRRDISLTPCEQRTSVHCHVR